jgi:hypothetical protein
MALRKDLPTKFLLSDTAKPPAAASKVALAKEATKLLQDVYTWADAEWKKKKACATAKSPAKGVQRDVFELRFFIIAEALLNEEGKTELHRAFLHRRTYHIELANSTSWEQSNHFLISGVHGLEDDRVARMLDIEWSRKLAHREKQLKGIVVPLEKGPKAFTVSDDSDLDDDHRLTVLPFASPPASRLRSVEDAPAEPAEDGKKQKKKGKKKSDE